LPQAARVRLRLALLIVFACTGCADLLKQAAQAPTPQQAAAANPPEVADAPPRFECSDRTFSTSQDACLVAMAKARLPPSH